MSRIFISHIPRLLVPLLLCLWFVVTPQASGATVRPHGMAMVAVIRQVEPAARRLTLSAQDGTVREVKWLRSTLFRQGQAKLDAAQLRPGMQVDVLYHEPIFGRPYISKLTLQR